MEHVIALAFIIFGIAYVLKQGNKKNMYDDIDAFQDQIDTQRCGDINTSMYSPVRLSAYIALGFSVIPGQIIADQLDYKYEYCRYVKDQYQADYFQSNPAFLDEYIIMLNANEFTDYVIELAKRLD